MNGRFGDGILRDRTLRCHRCSMANSSPVDSSAEQPEVDSELHDVAYFVHEEFDSQLDPQVVEECLYQVTLRFEGASVRVFVPLLVRRYVREDLKKRLQQTR